MVQKYVHVCKPDTGPAKIRTWDLVIISDAL